jgi:uncharacterized protein HemY
MLIIGVLLLVAVALLAAAAIGGGSGPVSFDVVNNTIETTGVATFLVGAVAGAVLIVALWMVRFGLRHSTARRHELRQLRREQRARKVETPAADREHVRARTDKTDTADSDAKRDEAGRSGLLIRH